MPNNTMAYFHIKEILFLPQYKDEYKNLNDHVIIKTMIEMIITDDKPFYLRIFFSKNIVSHWNSFWN